MQDIIYTSVKILTALPVNLWLWAVPLIAPFMIFFVSPERTTKSHMLRVGCAIALTYIFTNLAIHTGKYIERENYKQCNIAHQMTGESEHENCKHIINIADGTEIVFALYFGWVQAACYTGLWEII